MKQKKWKQRRAKKRKLMKYFYRLNEEHQDFILYEMDELYRKLDEDMYFPGKTWKLETAKKINSYAYKQALRDLGIRAIEFDTVISILYDKSEMELVELARIIKEKKHIMPVTRCALEWVLECADRLEAYKIYYNCED